MSTADLNQYLTFYLAGEEYAIPVLKVIEILEYNIITKVPSTPAWIRGVLNLRGAVVPVVDLAAKLGMPPTEIAPRTAIVIVEVPVDGERLVMGFIADSVHQVAEIGAAGIQAVPAFGPKVRIDYLAGMSRNGDRFVLILDIDRILSAQEILAVSAAVEDPAPAEAVAFVAATQSRLEEQPAS
ncbi:MAG TPA: chemotaxis protein CheW [Thermoanaerobaculia bacterium]|nr:chemotaxis protein CheW [Thermoanaerobaculia bacterium]